jgi:hypothetical protein
MDELRRIAQNGRHPPQEERERSNQRQMIDMRVELNGRMAAELRDTASQIDRVFRFDDAIVTKLIGCVAARRSGGPNMSFSLSL